MIRCSQKIISARKVEAAIDELDAVEDSAAIVALNVGVPDPQIFNVPVEFSLEIVAIVSSDFTHPKWEFSMMWLMKSIAFACWNRRKTCLQFWCVEPIATWSAEKHLSRIAVTSGST